MPFEYELKYVENGRATKMDIMNWINARGLNDWRPVYIDATWSHVIFEREIDINPKLRLRQLGKEIESLEKEDETDADRSNQDLETV